MFKLFSKYNSISLLAIVVVLNNILHFHFNIGLAYYGVMAVFLIALLIKGHITGYNNSFIFLLIAIVLSIITNDIDPHFSSWQRFLSFIIICSLVSPFISSPALNRFRCETYILLQYLMAAITILSIPLYIMGINYMGLEMRGFSGLTMHSMLMGAVAANASLFAYYKLSVENGRQHRGKIKYVLYIGLLIAGFIFVFLSRSRCTLLCLIFGMITLVWLKSRGNLGSATRTIIIIVVLAGATYPLWRQYTAGIQAKNMASEQNGSILSSREVLWKDRVDEFKESPIFGVGFSSIRKGDFSIRTGRVESGSSWLSILSMTGILGLIGFIGIYLGAFGRIKHNTLQRFRPSYCLIGAELVFYSVQMFAEGYIYGAGNYMFFCVWLTLGTLFAAEKMKMDTVTL